MDPWSGTDGFGRSDVVAASRDGRRDVVECGGCCCGMWVSAVAWGEEGARGRRWSGFGGGRLRLLLLRFLTVAVGAGVGDGVDAVADLVALKRSGGGGCGRR